MQSKLIRFATLMLMLLVAASLLSIEIGANETVLPQQATATAQDATPESISDVETHTIVMSYPRIIFTEADVFIDVFAPPLEDVRYIILDENIAQEIQMLWDIRWEQNAYGTIEAEMLLSIKPPLGERFEVYDESYDYIERTGTSSHIEPLTVQFIPSESGVYLVDAEINLSAIDATDEYYPSYAEFYQEVIVLDAGDPESLEPYTLESAFGTLATQGILLDWRSWHFGPCAWVDVFSIDWQALFETACDAYSNNDLDALEDIYLEGIDRAEEEGNIEIEVLLHDQLGTMSFVLGRWGIAGLHFEESTELWHEIGSGVDLTAALHNKAILHLENGDIAEGFDTIDIVLQLRELLDDWAGQMLTWAQIDIYNDDLADLPEMIDFFVEIELPQAEYLREWLAAQ